MTEVPPIAVLFIAAPRTPAVERTVAKLESNAPASGVANCTLNVVAVGAACVGVGVGVGAVS